MRWLGAALLLSLAALAHAASIDPRVAAGAAAHGSSDSLLILADQTRPTLAPLSAAADYRLRRGTLVDSLRNRAHSQQRDLRAWLDAHRIAHRDFWIANVIQARVPQALLGELSRRPELARIDANPAVTLSLPPATPTRSPKALQAISWGVAKIQAPAVWELGFTGQNVVIAGEDTGYQWDHPALQARYRGWNGVVADHSHNWHDAIHDATGNPCGNNSPAPCDDEGHGTHTAGTFVGDDGAGNQVGVAPGAKWIGCRNMDRGTGTPARYIECMQWLLAPTDLAGNNADPTLAPDVISNSWSCPQAPPVDGGEGCTPADILETAVANLVDAGIFYAAAAQNSGPSCATIFDPPALYDESFVIGATDENDALAGFSSRGPVASALVRPDVVAPGTNIVSSVPPSMYTTMSGTSMSTPHVAGAAALLMSAYPKLKGKPASIAAILRATATHAVTDPVVGQTCGGTTIGVWPNYIAGYGRIDALAAYHEILFMDGFGD